VVIRAIFDSVDEEIPEFVTAAAAADGSIDRLAVLRHAVLHPNTIPGLLQMRERLGTCSEALADFVARAVMPMETRLHELLTETSRTFALCIPLLGDATRLQVTLAYLLFRIADTFEDASHWPVADRLRALDAFCALLRNPEPEEARRFAITWHAQGPSPHAGYMQLIADIPLVIDTFAALPSQVKEIIRDHVIRSAQGMARFVAMTDNGKLQLGDVQQLRAYCYAVAGIVGEMLTELFLIRAPQLRSAAPFLRARAAIFGEGLQLVNILKDSLSDLSEGRTYIPPSADRAEILALARTDLESATEYTLTLQSGGAPHGIVAFAALPVALAQATLNRLERSKPGAKIGRAQVFRITRMVNRSVALGQPPLQSRSQMQSGLARMRSIFSLPFGNGS
jgi:farnesyl-diphosphate farnesyltransferase